MKTIEFDATPDSDGIITIPEAFRNQASGKKLTVTLLYKEEAGTAKPPEHYTKGYDQKDSLYDKY